MSFYRLGILHHVFGFNKCKILDHKHLVLKTIYFIIIKPFQDIVNFLGVKFNSDVKPNNKLFQVFEI